MGDRRNPNALLNILISETSSETLLDAQFLYVTIDWQNLAHGKNEMRAKAQKLNCFSNKFPPSIFDYVIPELYRLKA